VRYYSIVITSSSGSVVRPSSLASLNLPATWTSSTTGQPSGTLIPGAQNIELDIPVWTFGEPAGYGWLRVHGVSIQEVGQANDLNGLDIAIYGGMMKGLPLAKPQQAGLLAKGKIFVGFGNWIDTDMTVEMIFYSDTGSVESPKNISVNWTKGTPLSDMVQQTLSAAFPTMKTNINISPNLVLGDDQQGFHGTMEEFGAYVKAISQPIIGGNYPGVDISLTGDTFNVFDGTAQQGGPIMIAFEDMIGQPTWITTTSVQAKFVMRKDIVPGVNIQFPQGIPTTLSADAASPLVAQKTTFQGSFLVTSARHVGNFRQPTADAWVTVVEAAATSPQSAGG
jgi:hypothetical protein